MPLTWLQSEITFLIFLARMNKFKLHSYYLHSDTQTLKVKTNHLTPYLIPSVKVSIDVQQQQKHSSRNLRGGGRLCDGPKERLRKRIGLCEHDSVALPDMHWSSLTHFHVTTPRHFHKASLLFQRFLYVIIRDTEDSKTSLCPIRLYFSEDDNFDQVWDSGQLSVQQACV